MAGPMHKNLANGRWFTLSLAEQMGNIGSEVSRALGWREKNEKALSENAGQRALELFDLALSDSRWLKRFKEIARAREVFCDFFYGDNTYVSTQKNLEKYFYYFALSARIKR